MSFLSIRFSLYVVVETNLVCLHKVSDNCFFFIQTALRFRHSLPARNLLMRPFTGLPATVVITLGLSLVGSISSLLSSPTGNCPAFPKLAEIAHSMERGHGVPFGSAITRRSLSDKDIFSCQGAPVPSELNCYRTGKGEN